MKKTVLIFLAVFMCFILIACDNQNTATITCVNCGEKNATNAKFCQSCGKSVSSTNNEEDNTDTNDDSSNSPENNETDKTECLHQEIIDQAVAPTCTKDGKTEGKHCSLCGETLIAQNTISKLGHSIVTDYGYDATCQKTGLSNGSHCSVCNTVVSHQTTIAKVTHNYINGKCQWCEANDPNIKVDIPSQVIYNKNNVKITTKGMYEDEFGDTCVKLLIENNSTKNLLIQFDWCAINGYMIDPIFSEEIVSGKKVNTEVSFSSDDIDKICVDIIQNITFVLKFMDNDTWDNLFSSHIIELKSTPTITPTEQYDTSGVVVYNKNGVKIIAQKIFVNEWDDYNVVLYIENNSQADVMIQTRNVSVNGYMIEPIFSSEICAGMKIVDELCFWKDDLNDNDISSINEIALYFYVVERDSWNDIDYSPAITIHFENNIATKVNGSTGNGNTDTDNSNISASEMNLLLDYLQLSIDSHNNAIQCLTNYIKTSDQDYVTYFYEFISNAYDSVEEMHKISINHTDTQSMVAELESSKEILDDILYGSYTPIELGDMVQDSLANIVNVFDMAKKIVNSNIGTN